MGSKIDKCGEVVDGNVNNEVDDRREGGVIEKSGPNVDGKVISEKMATGPQEYWVFEDLGQNHAPGKFAGSWRAGEAKLGSKWVSKPCGLNSLQKLGLIMNCKKPRIT